MMFENREGHWQGSARLRLGKIRLRAADGPGKMERFWADVSVGATLKRGTFNRDGVRCPRKEGRMVVNATTHISVAI